MEYHLVMEIRTLLLHDAIGSNFILTQVARHRREPMVWSHLCEHQSQTKLTYPETKLR